MFGSQIKNVNYSQGELALVHLKSCVGVARRWKLSQVQKRELQP